MSGIDWSRAPDNFDPRKNDVSDYLSREGRAPVSEPTAVTVLTDAELEEVRSQVYRRTVLFSGHGLACLLATLDASRAEVEHLRAILKSEGYKL